MRLPPVEPSRGTDRRPCGGNRRDEEDPDRGRAEHGGHRQEGGRCERRAPRAYDDRHQCDQRREPQDEEHRRTLAGEEGPLSRRARGDPCRRRRAGGGGDGRCEGEGRAGRCRRSQGQGSPRLGAHVRPNTDPRRRIPAAVGAGLGERPRSAASESGPCRATTLTALDPLGVPVSARATLTAVVLAVGDAVASASGPPPSARAR